MIDSFYSRKFPKLNIDDNYVLREQTVEDTEAFFEYYSDPSVGRHILATKPRSIAEASAEIHYCRSLFQFKRGIYWTIAERNSNKMIGAIGLHINTHHRRGEISYDLSREYWNRGIMTKAMIKVVEFCFVNIGLKRVEAITLEVNGPSIAVLKKLGFIHEGTLKNYRYFNGASHDIEMYSITPEVIDQNQLFWEDDLPPVREASNS